MVHSGEESGRRIRTGTVSADINVTPMADIMLVLLIIFMITTPLLQTGVTVNLPKAVNPLENPKIDSEDAVIVAVTRDGNIYFGRQRVTQDELVSKLREKFASTGDKTMFIKGDTAASYGRFVEVVDLCRSSGVERIGLITEKERERR